METKAPIMIPSRIITGYLLPQNKNALDWGWQGLIAYGTQKTVVIVDPNTVQVVQTLARHRQPVCKVKWSKENYHHDAASPYSLRVASVDISGRVIVWDVAQGTQRTEFSENGKSVEDLEWLNCQDASHDLLVAIHSPNLFILWNADTGTKLWKKSYDNIPHLYSLTIDPFEPTRIAALGSDCILFVNDFSISRQPLSDGKKFYMSLDKATKNVTTPTRVNLSMVGRAALSGIKLLIGDEKPKEDEISLSDCKELSYLPSMRHHIAAVFPKEILILDVNVLQAVASVSLERNGSPFMQVLPVRQRAGLFCAHENGSLSFRIKRFSELSEDSLMADTNMSVADGMSSKYDLNFDYASHSEPFRVTNRVRPMCAALCPVTEQKVAVLISDGRIFIWKLSAVGKAKKPNNGLYVYGPRTYSLSNPKDHTLSAIVGASQSISRVEGGNATQSSWGDPIHVRFTMVGLFSCLSSTVTCLRMCPPLTHGNWPHYHPLIAVGMSSGNIQVYNLSNGKIAYEFGVHTCEVRGIEWIGLRSFVSYGYPHYSSQANANVTNEVMATDLQSGRTTTLRKDRSGESPINMMKVSTRKQYLLIVFNDKAMELWDINTRSLLRELPDNLPSIHAVEWAPLHTSKKPDRSEEGTGQLVDDLPSHTKEHLVLTDEAGTLYHCIVEGSSFKQGSKIPHTSERNSNITCISWKHDHIFMGDTDGTISCWNLRTKMAKTVQTHKGWIKKIRFGPGKGNLSVVVLYDDGCEVWDADAVKCMNAVRTPKQMPKINDLDWCASDKLVISCENGQIFVIDCSFTLPLYHLPTTDQIYSKPLSCPYLLPTKTALLMKAMLQHGVLSINSLGSDVENVEALQKAIDALPSSVRELLSKTDSTLVRCAAVARIFGDESEVHLWTILSHYFTDENNKEFLFTDLDLDALCDCETYRLSELQRCLRHSMFRNNPSQTKRCIEDLILLGQIDKAINLSLETEPSSKSYYQDCLKSCLLAALKCNPESSQNNVKLIATNLIANDNLREGIELLCMINKSLDACRYLTSHGQWELAVWLAKLRLSGAEYEEIMLRWANHLCSPRVNHKSKAIMVYISLRKFSKVLQTFYIQSILSTRMFLQFRMRHFDRAAMFSQVCQELNLLKDEAEENSLISSVHMEYARYLRNLGCNGQLVDLHSTKAEETRISESTDKGAGNEAASDDTTSSDCSVVVVASPSCNSTSDEYEKVDIGAG